MEGKTYIFVFFSGLCFLPACFPRTYILVEQAKTWAGAQDYCRSKYTDLATINNQEDLDVVVAVSQTYYGGHVWIGLYDDINSWRWSLEKEGYYGDGEAEFRMWLSGQPNNIGGYENCAKMEPTGFWRDAPCRSKHMFVCYNETPTSSSFVPVTESKTWNEAQSHCREHYTDLVSVRNQAENEQIKNIIPDQTTWIGLYRDSWKWSDGDPTPFRAWYSDDDYNEPNGNIGENCVLLHEGQWADSNCDWELFFVCDVVPVKQQVMKVKVTKNDSSVNLEDETEAIMQQFIQTLKDRSLSEDMKLTWRKQPDGKVFNSEEKEDEVEMKESEEISCVT